MTEDEMMQKFAEAHGCGELRMPKLTDEQLKRLREGIERQPIHIEPDSPVRPLPCVRDENGEIREQTVKKLFAKVDEELNETKAAFVLWHIAPQREDSVRRKLFAEEAADTITAITTLLEALGINAEARDEAQSRVNSKNRERGRL